MNLLGTKLALSVLAAMPLLSIQMDQAIASHAATIVAVKEARICFYNKATGERYRKCQYLKPVKLKELTMEGSSHESPLEI